MLVSMLMAGSFFRLSFPHIRPRLLPVR
jgi:hypothetical protein